jgi:electron transfer flavoprotein-quinone oxidoreductase
LEQSFVLKDLYKIRHMTDFAHARPHLLNGIPEALSKAAREYLTVDNLPLSHKQKQITKLLRQGIPLRQSLNDALGLIRAMR